MLMFETLAWQSRLIFLSQNLCLLWLVPIATLPQVRKCSLHIGAVIIAILLVKVLESHFNLLL